VVAATLPSAALKDDKVAFRAQEMCMEAVAPLAALLESTDDENFTHQRGHSYGTVSC